MTFETTVEAISREYTMDYILQSQKGFRARQSLIIREEKQEETRLYNGYDSSSVRKSNHRMCCH